MGGPGTLCHAFGGTRDEVARRARLPRKRIRAPSGALRSFRHRPEVFGAGEGIRTLDPNLGKVVLYP